MGNTRILGGLQADTFLGAMYEHSPFGKLWFVDGTNGSDGNSGEAFDEALASIGQAITNAVASRGDTVVIRPGTYTITAVLAPKAMMTFRAAVVNPQFPTVSVRGNLANLMTVDVDGVRVIGLEFRATGGVNRNLVHVSDTTAVNGLTFEDCVFHGADQGGGAVRGMNGVCGLNVKDGTNATTGLVVRRCVFRDLGKTQINIGVLGAPYAKIENNLFAIDTDTGIGIHLADTTAFGTGKGFVIRENDFTGFDSSATETGINIGAATEDATAGGMIRTNYFAYLGVSGGATTPISPNRIPRALVNNYFGDTGTGGTLSDAGN